VSRPATAKRTRVLVDTDIGGDIDDANALAFLVASPEVELVGVTTVGAGGSARLRAQVAASLLEAAGRPDIEVSAGIDQPLRDNPVLRLIPPERILNAHEPSMAAAPVSSVGAVERIAQVAHDHAGELVLLSIGCLTNVASAILEAPDALRRVARLVVMAGAFEEQTREANATIDPEAADIVFRSGLPLQVIGLEVARQVRLPLSVYEEAPFAATRLGRFLGRAGARFRDAYGLDSMTLYDVLPAAAVTDAELFGFAERRIAVELDGRHTRGITVIERDSDLNAVPGGSVASVAEHVQAAAVERLFRERVLEGEWS
jgi:purine nucleosidase